MSITNLKPPSSSTAAHVPTPMRDTAAQDVARATHAPAWYRRKAAYIAAAGAVGLALVLAWLVRSWAQSGGVVSRQSLELATVTRGSFVQDVSGRGTVIAAVSPSLFATAAGTIRYAVHAGDRVSAGQVLAHLSSPDLGNQYQRELATLQSLDAALARERIELRQQLLSNQQQADLAAVRMQAALRDLQREQAAWSLHVISERRYEAEYDTFSVSRLSFEHARENARLAQQQILLELRTRTLARNAQALLVAGLKQRLDALTVRSPVTGMVAVLAQADQSYVPENAPLLTVVDLSALAIQFQVAESLADGIAPGVAAQITLDGETVEGIVTDVSPAVQDGWVTGRARFVGPQPAGLRQNEQAAVRIILGRQRHVLKLDRGAYLGPQTRFVYVIRGDEAVRTPVSLGAASIAEIQVLHGLAAGARVVISDPEPFRDAPQVRLSR
jgi:HlyD family secretion protein